MIVDNGCPGLVRQGMKYLATKRATTYLERAYRGYAKEK